MSRKTIELSLLESFYDKDLFSIAEANEAIKEDGLEVEPHSVRARIYEGIDKKVFKRVSRGVFKVTHKGVECVVVQGDGRDLSSIKSGSIDLIITDHPYDLRKSHKGGNRSLADYTCFRYNQEDFAEKNRVLKDGGFLIEFIPEESEANFEYLYDIKKLALDNGFKYYAKVPWKKGSFKSNMGRKAKNTEDIIIFSKGRARELRFDAKRSTEEETVRMSGSSRMIPTVLDHQPPSRSERIHQAEKPVSLMIELLELFSLEEEIVLDQFAGSGVLAEACLLSERNSIVIEKDEESYNKIVERVNAVKERL